MKTRSQSKIKLKTPLRNHDKVSNDKVKTANRKTASNEKCLRKTRARVISKQTDAKYKRGSRVKKSHIIEQSDRSHSETKSSEYLFTLNECETNESVRSGCESREISNNNVVDIRDHPYASKSVIDENEIVLRRQRQQLSESKYQISSSTETCDCEDVYDTEPSNNKDEFEKTEKVVIECEVEQDHIVSKQCLLEFPEDGHDTIDSNSNHNIYVDGSVYLHTNSDAPETHQDTNEEEHSGEKDMPNLLSGVTKAESDVMSKDSKSFEEPLSEEVVPEAEVFDVNQNVDDPALASGDTEEDVTTGQDYDGQLTPNMSDIIGHCNKYEDATVTADFESHLDDNSHNVQCVNAPVIESEDSKVDASDEDVDEHPVTGFEGHCDVDYMFGDATSDNDSKSGVAYDNSMSNRSETTLTPEQTDGVASDDCGTSGTFDTEPVTHYEAEPYDVVRITEYCENVIKNSLSLLINLAKGDSDHDEKQDLENNDGSIPPIPRARGHLYLHDLDGLVYYEGPSPCQHISPWWYIKLQRANDQGEHVSEDVVSCDSQTDSGSTAGDDVCYSDDGTDYTEGTNEDVLPTAGLSQDPFRNDDVFYDLKSIFGTQDDKRNTDFLLADNSEFASFNLWSEIEKDLLTLPADMESVDVSDSWLPELDDMLQGNRSSNWLQEEQAGDYIRLTPDPSPPSPQPLRQLKGKGRYNKLQLMRQIKKENALNASNDIDSDLDDISDTDFEDLDLSCLQESIISDDSGKIFTKGLGNGGYGKQMTSLYRQLGKRNKMLAGDVAPDEEDSELCASNDDESEPRHLLDETPSSCLPEDLLRQWNIANVFEDGETSYDDFHSFCSFMEESNASGSFFSTPNKRLCPRQRTLSGYEADVEQTSPILHKDSPSRASLRRPPVSLLSPSVRRRLQIYGTPNHKIRRRLRQSGPVVSNVPIEVGTTDGEKSDADDLNDLSVESTVDFFLKMSSPLQSDDSTVGSLLCPTDI